MSLETAPLPQQQDAGSLESRIDPSLLHGDGVIADDTFHSSDDDYGFTPLSQVLPSDTKTQEINTLREDIVILDRDRSNMNRRKEIYKARLHNQEEHIRSLEQQVQRLEGYNRVLHDRDLFNRGVVSAVGENLQPPEQWKYCAMKAYDILVKREKTILEQERAIQEQEQVIQEQEQTIEAQRSRVGDIEKEMEALKMTSSQ